MRFRTIRSARGPASRSPLRFLAAGLALAGAALAGASARADDSGDLDPLTALDTVLPKLAERAERSVVALDVSREDTPDRPLTRREKMSLGIGGERVYDERYFERPPGAVTAVVVASDATSSTLVTCLWNVRDAKSVLVSLPTGDKVPAKIKGHDDNLDVAVLVTDKPLAGVDPIPVARERKVGQFALLVGRGGERSQPVVTVGSISAVGRFKGDAIQVSTRMNYGNVGGAVIDLDGRLLGVASKLNDRAMQGLNSGVGFAAPVDRLLKELGALAAGKTIPRRKNPFLGIMFDPKLQQPKDGVRIALARMPDGKLLDNSAALKAGIEDRDIIKIFNGVDVKDFESLRDCIEKLEPGEKVIVTIERGDLGEKDFTIELGERPEGEE